MLVTGDAIVAIERMMVDGQPAPGVPRNAGAGTCPSATRAEATAVTQGRYAAHASVNRTCEIGRSRATDRTYPHLLELLPEATS